MRPCIFSIVLGVAGEVRILCLRDVLENQKTKNERKRTLTLGIPTTTMAITETIWDYSSVRSLGAKQLLSKSHLILTISPLKYILLFSLSREGIRSILCTHINLPILAEHKGSEH